MTSAFRLLTSVFRQNERRFAGPQQLQLFPDLHFLFTGAGLKPLDALFPALILARGGCVLFLESPNLTMLVEERLDPLRAAHRH